MFDIGWPEMLVVAIVLIVIVGPKDLPGMLRNFGRTTTKLRSMAGDFRKQFDEALKEAELDDVKGVVDDMRKLNPAGDLRKALNPMRQAAEDMRTGLDSAMKPNAHPQNAKEAAEARAAAAATEAKTAEPLKNGQDKPAAGGGKKTPAATGKTSKAKPKASATKSKPAAKAGTARSSAAKSGAAKTRAAKSGTAKTASAKPAAKPKAAPKRSTAKSGNAAGGAKKGRQAS